MDLKLTRTAPQLAMGWRPVLYGLAAVASVGLVAGAWQNALPLPVELDRAEVLAFVTGAWSVWLAARNNVWTWPIGIVNSIFFVVLFWQARLYFDTGINVFYVLSGLWGWWIWTLGGRARTRKPIGHVGWREALALVTAGVVLTGVMWQRGVAIADAAPFLDALTTALSMLAQWLLMRRLIQNWYGWIMADLVYVPLYAARGLPLTAILYALFLLMCLRGYLDWRASLLAAQQRG